MRKLKFLKLLLLSQLEKKAFVISFTEKPTIIQAPNGYGKSALIKSLYDTFGATPHKIDALWAKSRVYSMVRFSLDGKNYAIVKAGDVYALFDDQGKRILKTSEIMRDLSPFLADLFDFKLALKDQRERSVVPPPSYIFAPYYIDQDKSWSNVWSPFTQMYLPKSAKFLSDYHSGSRGNAYYEAQSERDNFRLDLKDIEASRAVAVKALEFVEKISPETSISYRLEDFRSEIDSIVSESQNLSRKQISIKDKIGRYANEREVWIEQHKLLTLAISESKSVLAVAVKRPAEIECPTCGHSYENSIAEQFGLVEDYDGFAVSLISADEKIRHLNNVIEQHTRSIVELNEDLLKIESIYAVQRELATFKDVVVSQGKNETGKIVRVEIEKNDESMEETRSLVSEAEKRMALSIDKEKSREIKEFFDRKLKEFSASLDVKIEEDNIKLDAPSGSRGSEGPRGMISYYYAFIHVSYVYSPATFCPIVIDAPNQQGQDRDHLRRVIELIVRERPGDAQLILGIEDVFDVKSMDVDLITLDGPKDNLLNSREYSAVMDEMRPYISALL